jgi:hypothetical protein
VVPATLVITAIGVLGLVVALLRGGITGRTTRGAALRRQAMRSAALAAAVGLVLWAPVLYEQFSRSPGNIERIARYAGDKSRGDVGYGSALRQVAHAIGLPPLLGRINVTGPELLARLSPLTLVSALAAVGLLAAGAVLWRRREPRLTALVVMAGAVALGGLFNGANVPVSLEQIRIAFYHWTFTLAFLELLILLLAVGPPVWRWYAAREPARQSAVRALAGPVVVLVVLVTGVANLVVHRRDNQPLLLIAKRTIDHIESEVQANTPKMAQPTLLLSTEYLAFSGTYEAIASRLIADGIDIKFPADRRDYVADRHLVDYRTVQSGIVLAFGIGGPRTDIPGTIIATANPAPGLDRQALARLFRQVRSGAKVVLGRPLERALRSRVDGPTIRASLLSIAEDPAKVLANRLVLRLLVKAPLVSPALDSADLARVLRTFPTAQGVAMSATHLSLYRLDRPQLLQFARRRGLRVGAG